jgi:hypothetical protein
MSRSFKSKIYTIITRKSFNLRVVADYNWFQGIKFNRCCFHLSGAKMVSLHAKSARCSGGVYGGTYRHLQAPNRVILIAILQAVDVPVPIALSLSTRDLLTLNQFCITQSPVVYLLSPPSFPAIASCCFMASRRCL